MHGRSRCLPVAGDCLPTILRENGAFSRSATGRQIWRRSLRWSVQNRPAIHPQTPVPGGEGPIGPSPSPLPKSMVFDRRNTNTEHSRLKPDRWFPVPRFVRLIGRFESTHKGPPEPPTTARSPWLQPCSCPSVTIRAIHPKRRSAAPRNSNRSRSGEGESQAQPVGKS